MKKKLLMYSNYFWPEVASTGQILTELCLGLKDEYDITVIYSVACYTGSIDDKYKTKKFYYEEYEGLKIIRVKVCEFVKTKKISRIKNILGYFFNAISATRKVGRQDIVFTASQPPVLGGILGTIGKRITKGKLIYNIQDFNPEQTKAVNYSKNKLVLNAMMWFDKRSCRKSDLVVVVGHDMQETLKNRFNNKKVPNNTVINNWMNEKEVYPLEKSNERIVEFKKKYNLDNKFVIMYSGNIGLYYDLENIIHIIGKFKDNKDVVFAFVGEGAIKRKLETIVKDNNYNNVVFIPYQDKKDIIYSLNAADVHLVTNSKGIKGVSVPSKIYGCMATNVPVLGILEKGSEAWNIIEDSNCGILAETEDYEQIENRLKTIIEEKNAFVDNHSTGREYLVNNFTKDKSVEKYKEELNKLVK